MRVLVTGGTGVVGRPAVTELVRRGHQVRILSRHAERDVEDWPRGVEPFQAHVADPAALRGAAAGCDAVLHIAGIVAESPPEVTFQKVNVEGTRNMLDEAERAGVGRFVFVSSLGAERGSSDYHRSKMAAEALVRGYARDWQILRPGNVYGPGDEVVSLLLKMVRTMPMVPIVGTGDHAFQPVWAEDVGLALALAVEQDRSGEVLEMAGEEVVTVSELLDLLEELTDRHPPRMPVPEPMAQMGVEAAEALGVDLRLHSDQLVMLREENVIPPGHVNALVEVFGIEPTPLADGLAKLADALPERLPDEGTGPLERHRYWAEIRGSAYSAEELIRLVRSEFGELTPPGLVRVGVEPGSEAAMEEGATLTLAIPLRGNIQVRVEEVTPRSVTAVTLEGHPLSGTIRFVADDCPDGAIRFEVRTFTRPSTLVDRVVMASMGDAMKGSAWSTLVESVVERSRGEAIDGVHRTVEELDAEASRDVERWVEGLVHRRRRNANS